MPLTGTYTRSLDEKQRLAVPKRLRDQFGEKELGDFYVAPGPDHSLELYSPAGFERVAERRSTLSSTRSDVRDYLRVFYSQAESVQVDGQGRIRLPERLVAFARLRKDVVLLGVQDHVEIWDQEVWREYLDRQRDRFDDLATTAFE